MKTINLETRERTAHYLFFKRMDYPQYNICTNLDITNFYHKTKAQKIPFYYAMIYAATYTLNQVENFKYRIRGEHVVLHDVIHPYFTDMSKGSDLFKMVLTEMQPTIEAFTHTAYQKAMAQTDYFIKTDVEGRDDLTYITCIPWVSFTSLSHTISFHKEDSVPRLAWGKYFTVNGKVLLPFSVQAHHSFVDGIDMGQYIDTLQNYCNNYC